MNKSLFKFLILLLSVYSNAQNLKFEHYNDTDGLSHNSVRHIVQDSKGFLWLGTFSGLNRFDGYQFKTYTSTAPNFNKLLNDDITVLELDAASHHLWIGTRNGLTLFKTDTQTFTTYLNKEDKTLNFPDEEIRSVHVDKFKRVWVGTKSAGLYIFLPNEGSFTKIDLPGFEYVKEIFEDKKGNIWVGSFGTAGVAKITLDGSGNIAELMSYTLSISNSAESNPYINFIYEDAKSDMFVGTREGLYKFNKEENQFKNLYIQDHTIRENLGPYFLSVAQAPDGKYWVGTLGGLLVCNSLEDIERGEFEWHYSILSDDTSLVDNLISALFFDASGVLWIGTEDGLDKFDPYENQFKLNKDISNYIDNQAPRIRGFSKTFDDKVVVATWHNGLFLSKNGSFIPLYHNNDDIASIHSFDGKIFYCGLWNGNILVYNYLQNTSKIVDVGFQNSPIFTFLQYDEDTIIVGSFGEGALALDSRTLEVQDEQAKMLEGYQINKVVKEGEHLWFATESGIVKYNYTSKGIKIYKHTTANENGLPHDNLSDVLIDFDKNIWAATRKGLAVYDESIDDFQVISSPRELVGRWVTDLAMEADGNLWLNMNNNNIAKYNTKLKTANVYHVLSGNRLDVFSSHGFFKYNDSKIYIAGKGGVIYFSPYSITENKHTPEPIITEFKIGNKEIIPNTSINDQIPFTTGLNYGKKAVLNYENRNFSIQFSSPSFSNPRLNKFQYKLEGFDEDWIETSSASRTVQYTNLFSKDYTFKIRSSNSDGNWSKVSAYKIEVLPTFWLTYKGITIILIVLGLIIYLLRDQLNSRLKLKQELLLEKVKRERDEKLNNEKLRFFTNISHELRTPLTLILGPVKQLMEPGNSVEYNQSRVALIYQNANRLLRLVNQILDFRRAETGTLKLIVSKTDILVSTKNIFNSFLELANAKDISLNLNTEEEEDFVCWIDLDKYNKVLYNLLSNAVKFTEESGNVDVFLGFKDKKQRKLILEVSDNGIGIPYESQEKIFTRFYQAQNSKSSTTGTGIGLSLVKALVEIHKGEIRMQSVPNVGSIFTIELPAYKKAFNQEEIADFVANKTDVDKLVSFKKIQAAIPQSGLQTNADVKHAILVVEDNAELRKYIVEYLSAFYKVYEAENGEEGIMVCKKVKPVLCVVDVMMPKMDGFHFVEELKSDENISHIAVILLTALAENENRIKGYEIGVDGYLVKPFDPSLLKTRIDNIIKIHFDLKQKFSGEVEGDVMALAHSQLDIDLITQVKEMIELHISSANLTSNFLCKELGMSSSKLYRKIKQLTDLSPNEFIRTIRLKKSAQLLKTKKYNVSEVATMVGFNDPLYFSRCFKKQFNYSPSSLIK